MNDIRAALDDLAGRPPLVLGRRGAVMNRIATVQRRRKVAAHAVMASFVVAFAAAGATRVVLHLRPTGADSIVEVSESPRPEPTESPEPAVESPKPTESPKPKPVEPVEPTAKPAPRPEPVTVPKPEPTKAPAAGLTVGLYPYAEAKAGREMQWKVKAYDGAGRLLRIELRFGDDSSVVYEPTEPCGDGVSLAKLVGHTYAQAGTYGARLTVTTGDCGAETQTRTAESSVTVKAVEQTYTNGPAQPTVSAEQVAGEVATLNLLGSDADGYVKKFSISWGDGTESSVGPRSFDGCQNAEGTTHPKPSSWDPQATHAYETPGTYTVTVTVVSASCAVTDFQSATVTISVTV